MKHLNPHSSWKWRKLYDKFIANKRKPILKIFPDAYTRDTCRISLNRIRNRRNENFFIVQRGLSITLTDTEGESLYADCG